MATSTDPLTSEIAEEQAHVDRVYAELAKAGERAELVEAEGLARGRTDRTGDVRDEEITGLFERDAMVFVASRRRHHLDQQYEGLVFGRLDLDDVSAALSPNPQGRPTPQNPAITATDASDASDAPDAMGWPETAMRDLDVRYIGRLGVRDDEYEPLVVDWRAPAAAPFYRATPVSRQGVVRRRVLNCRGARVVGVEDDLMVAQAPEGMVVIGDGALLAALSRSRGGTMRDIVATIQAHQDEAIRASSRGVTEITGGPGTGKTVVALHRAAYLLYSDRRRFETGGILVVGPSTAFTAYIERVLPSLGEESVTLRALGDLVDAVTAPRVDPPAAAAVKGSLRMRDVLTRAARDAIPGTPPELPVFVMGQALRLRRPALDRARAQVLRNHPRNASTEPMAAALANAAWSLVSSGSSALTQQERGQFLDRFIDHRSVEEFLSRWWRPVDPREVLLWLADRERATQYAAGLLSPEEIDHLVDSLQEALRTGTWSVADVALIDDLAARLGPIVEVAQERGFYEVDLLDDAAAELGALGGGREITRPPGSTHRQDGDHDPLGRLLRGRIERPGEYAHLLVDEAQDLSPMQWRALGRRARGASWTVVGDAAQASWADVAEARTARDEAFGGQQRRTFHMTTNYRNAREIFEYAARVITPVMPDADIPEAVRDTGVDPVEATGSAAPASAFLEAVHGQLDDVVGQVDGAVAVIAPARWLGPLAPLAGAYDGRVTLIDPLSTKGLEWDATVVVDPDEIVASSPGGARILYVCLTRAAHRMHVVRAR